MVTNIDRDGKIRLSRQAVLEGWTVEQAQEMDRGGLAAAAATAPVGAPAEIAVVTAAAIATAVTGAAAAAIAALVANPQQQNPKGLGRPLGLFFCCIRIDHKGL